MHEVELAITARAEKTDLAVHSQVGQAWGSHTPEGPVGMG